MTGPHLPGWALRCPVCHRLVLPTDASFRYLAAPRLVWHLLDQHPFEFVVLRGLMNHPPAEWPVVDDEAA